MNSNTNHKNIKYLGESKVLQYFKLFCILCFKYFSICSQDWVYGGVDWWCFVKDQILLTMYECLCSAVVQPFHAWPHLPKLKREWFKKNCEHFYGSNFIMISNIFHTCQHILVIFHWWKIARIHISSAFLLKTFLLKC